MIHERVFGTLPPAASLQFDGSTYDLGWDGRRSNVEGDNVVLPTADFALFLINAVKFHCGQLFHLFDEEYFMRKFSTFHETSDGASSGNRDRDLWYVHYVLIIALGKAFIVRASKDSRPPGADMFVHAMKLLPDITYLCTDPIQSIEIFCCAALYLQCLDMRNAAYNLVGLQLLVADPANVITVRSSNAYFSSGRSSCRLCQSASLPSNTRER